jgi:predicted dehydrogenase
VSPAAGSSARAGLSVGIVGCGLIGHKRAEALGAGDWVVGAVDPVGERAEVLVAAHGGAACADLDALLGLEPDVVVVATTHDQLAPLTLRALDGGAHVLVEKPAGLGTTQILELLGAAQRTGGRAKVGFNHRFHPGLQELAAEIQSGAHGELMHLRGRYGHGGRIGYDREWRADPQRAPIRSDQVGGS